MTIQHENVLMPVKEIEREFREPPLWKVIFYNDDYTPLEFVVQILETIYQKSGPEAEALAKKIHNESLSAVGLYPKEVAETKKVQTERIALRYEFPLRCEIEEDAPAATRKIKP